MNKEERSKQIESALLLINDICVDNNIEIGSSMGEVSVQSTADNEGHVDELWIPFIKGHKTPEQVSKEIAFNNPS